jgi:hypothetical protein
MREWDIDGMISGRENRSTRRKTCPSDILFNTNPTWTAMEINSGLRSEKPALTDRLFACYILIVGIRLRVTEFWNFVDRLAI